MPPTHLFLIDVSYNAVAYGGLASVCSSLLRLLDELQGAHDCLLTRAATVHGNTIAACEA